MGFLSNRSVTYLNLSNGFAEILTQIVMVFGSLFLYQHGFSMAGVFFTLGAISLGRVLTRLISFPLVQKIGLQKTVALGLIGWGVAILLLSRVQGLDGWFFAYVLVYIFFNPMYWVCFHMYYTLMGDAQHRGKQYAMRGVFILGGQAIFPLISAEVIRSFGYPWYFALAIPIVAVALTLLFMCPDKAVPKISWEWSPQQMRTTGMKTGLFQAFNDAITGNLWMFVLYLFFGGKLVSFGGILTFGVVMQIVFQLLIGHRFDKGHADRIASIGATGQILTAFGRVFMPLSVPVILCLELLAAAARLHVKSVVDIATYNDSHNAEHIVWYWVFTEMARDMGAVCGTWTAGLLLYSGTDPRTTILLAVPGIMLLWRVLVNVVTRKG